MKEKLVLWFSLVLILSTLLWFRCWLCSCLIVIAFVKAWRINRRRDSTFISREKRMNNLRGRKRKNGVVNTRHGEEHFCKECGCCWTDCWTAVCTPVVYRNVSEGFWRRNASEPFRMVQLSAATKEWPCTGSSTADNRAQRD